MNVTEFVDDLRRIGPGTCPHPTDVGRSLRSAASAAFPRERFPRFPGGYSRTLIYADDEFELVVCRWSPGAVSPIHDHGGQRCWLAVLDGSLRVENFRRFGPSDAPSRIDACGEVVLAPFDVDARIDDDDLHLVASVGGEDILSLHVYAHPIRAYRVYDRRTRAARMNETGYDLLLDSLPAG